MSDEIHSKEYGQRLEQSRRAIHETLLKCHREARIGGWREDHISTQVLSVIGGLGTRLSWPTRAVTWEALKLERHGEYANGDVAVLVRVWISETAFVDGVAFYEAKRQHFEDGKAQGFKAIDKAQLSRISSTTSASRLLLYDVEQQKQVFAAISVPTAVGQEVVRARSSDKRLLHYFGQPWLYDLAENLQGFGLDFRKEIVSAVRAASHVHRTGLILNAAVASRGLIPRLAPRPHRDYVQIVGSPSMVGPTPSPSETPERSMTFAGSLRRARPNRLQRAQRRHSCHLAHSLRTDRLTCLASMW